MVRAAKKWVYLMLGHFAVALGVIGIVLPLLPTTPFILLAAFFYSKGSARVHRWFVTHRLFGPLIVDWERHGVIRRRTKILALTMIVLMLSYPIIFVAIPMAIKMVIVASVIPVVIFIWSRPSLPAMTRQK